MAWGFAGAGTAKGRTPVTRDAALDHRAVPLTRPPNSAAGLTAYLRIRLRSTYCMMPPLR